MSTQTLTERNSIWLYGVCTFQDVEAERDDPSVDMDMMSAPQVAIIAPGYSEAFVRELATDALDELAIEDEIAGYDPALDLRGVSLDDLEHVMSCARPERLQGLPHVILETVVHDYYHPADSCHLIRVTVQKRSVRSLDNHEPKLTERVSVRHTAPGDN